MHHTILHKTLGYNYNFYGDFCTFNTKLDKCPMAKCPTTAVIDQSRTETKPGTNLADRIHITEDDSKQHFITIDDMELCTCLENSIKNFLQNLI